MILRIIFICRISQSLRTNLCICKAIFYWRTTFPLDFILFFLEKMRNNILSLVVSLSLRDNHVSRSYSTIRRKHRVKGLCRRLGLAVLYRCFLHSFPCVWKALSPVLLAMRCVMQWALNQHQLPELLTVLQLVYWTFRPLFNSKCNILSLMSWFFMKFPLFCLFWDALSWIPCSLSLCDELTVHFRLLFHFIMYCSELR